MNGDTPGMRIQDLRMRKNITQAELGEAISVSRDVIAKWENGDREIKASNLVAIADYFHVSIDYLLCRTDITTANPTIAQIAQITGLSNDSLCVLAEATGNLSLFPDISTKDLGPLEDSEELLEFLNIIIPSLPYSYLLKDFFNLLQICKSAVSFETNDTKGSWIDVDDKSLLVTMRNGEAVNYLIYEICQELQPIIAEGLEYKYGIKGRR